MTKILVIGASGQLGSVLTEKLQEKYGTINVIASDLRVNPSFKGYFEVLDATNFEGLKQIVLQFEITQIYHLAAILSANGEKSPLSTWYINMKSLFNVLEVSRLTNIDKVFFPSSIAVYGNDAPKIKTPQDYVLAPPQCMALVKWLGKIGLIIIMKDMVLTSVQYDTQELLDISHCLEAEQQIMLLIFFIKR